MFQLSSRRVAELRAGAPQVVRCEGTKTGFRGIQLDHMPDHAFRDAITPALTRPANTTEYSSRMELSCTKPLIQGRLSHSGTGTVRMCPPLPTRSTMAQCSSRCCKCANSKSANSRLRSPQPSKMARIVRFRLPFNVCGSGVCQKRRASSAVSQLPSLRPNFLGPLTRRMLAASSGLSKPASAAS